MKHCFALLGLLPLLAGCGVSGEYAENHAFTAPLAYTTGDVRIIMQRNDHLGDHTVVCTEPSPDVAKAISTIASVEANIRGNGGNASFGSQQALAELAGRSTALLGLRDGLFRARPMRTVRSEMMRMLSFSAAMGSLWRRCS